METLLKNNGFSLKHEINDHRESLQNVCSDKPLAIDILRPIVESLKELELNRIITFKYSDDIKDVDVLDPIITYNTILEMEEIDKIIYLMSKNNLSIPQDVLIRKKELSRHIELRERIRSFENWIVGHMIYLGEHEVESILYSPRLGFLVKYTYEEKSKRYSIADINHSTRSRTQSSYPHKKKVLIVHLDNGSIIEEERAIDTFFRFVEHIGINKYRNIQNSLSIINTYLTTSRSPSYSSSKRLRSGEYLYVKGSVEQIMQAVNYIAKYYGLEIYAEIIDKLIKE